ncbi:MAG: ribonuclease HI family protein, partial [Candidatus Micrarchaeaceae archaeon]
MLQKIYINTDGGSRKNPGPAAIGIVIWDEKHNKLEEYKECIGVATNNTAEYKAVIKALELASKHTRNEVHIFTDSELVVRQLNGLYRIKKDHLRDLFQEVKKNEQLFKKVVYNEVPRNNKYQVVADKLVNDALEGK